jgi:hypothetical protein
MIDASARRFGSVRGFVVEFSVLLSGELKNPRRRDDLRFRDSEEASLMERAAGSGVSGGADSGGGR